MCAVVGETVTAILRSYPGMTYARSSSDLAQPLRTKLIDLPVLRCPDLTTRRRPVGGWLLSSPCGDVSCGG